jgi:Ca2+-binding RTX toxin-like protein
MSFVKALFGGKNNTRRGGPAWRQTARARLGLEHLEGRLVPATVGVNKCAALDFDGDSISRAELREGGWDLSSGRTFASFHSLFTSSRPWLDLNGDGAVNGPDATWAIDNVIMPKVLHDFAPFKLSVFQGDQDDNQRWLSDWIVGDVMVIITGSQDFLPSNAWGRVPSTSSDLLNRVNNDDEIAFVFAGGSVDWFAWNPTGWLNQIAATISHEMGHAFGLRHETSDPRGSLDHITHSIMGAADVTGDGFMDRDWSRDFVFQDMYYTTDAGVSQDAHRHLLREDILGESDRTWMAVLKPGELTVSGNSAGNDLTVFAGPGRSWNVSIDGATRNVSLSAVDVESLNPFDQDLGRINVLGKAGDDYVYLSIALTVPTYVYAGAGNDTVYGGSGKDWLMGEAGNDRLYGWAGEDVLVGGLDNDDLYGEGDKDWLYGDPGDDYLNGGNDGFADYLRGGTGADRFAPEWYWNGFYFVNRDGPDDYTPGEGDRYA